MLSPVTHIPFDERTFIHYDPSTDMYLFQAFAPASKVSDILSGSPHLAIDLPSSRVRSLRDGFILSLFD